MKPDKSVIASVLFCHFLASFTALGMPLFLPKVMQDLLGPDMGMMIGWYFILPTICTALAAPWWGRFADCYGKRLSLLRAQSGLALGFMIAGLSNDLMVFTLGLLIQGICGGTYAASNAYLATQVENHELPRVLNWTQFSARLSLLVAPVVFGFLMANDKPRTLYCYLAVLPMLAAVLVSRLPVDSREKSVKAKTECIMTDAPLSFNQVLMVQFFFSFSMVVSFPYFLPFAEQLGLKDSGLIGWYFSLPHLVYLFITALGNRWQQKINILHLCMSGLIGLIIAAMLHTWIKTEAWLWLARLLMGAGLSLTFIALHRCFSALKAHKQAGLVFGRFDSAGKWAGVIGGIVSGLVVELQGLTAPFWLSALAAAIALSVIFFPQSSSLTRYLTRNLNRNLNRNLTKREDL